MIFGLFEEHGPITAFQLSSDRSVEAGEQQWALSIWNKQINHSGWVVKIPNRSPVRTFWGGEEAKRVWSKQFERSCEHSGPVRAFKLSGEGWQRPQRTLPSCPHNALKCVDRVRTRPVHKNLLLEFSKMQGRFMLHFALIIIIHSNVGTGCAVHLTKIMGK